jgi:RsiW-degrading membrane proteinase PrsW (M82 family)
MALGLASMSSRRDPVQEAAGAEFDLYDVATWEPRNRLDRLATTLYWLGSASARALVVLLAAAILFSQIALGSIGVIQDRPLVLVFALFSVAPALAIAAYIWHGDVARREPLSTLVVTFVLAVLFASFAAVINSALGGSIAGGSLLIVPFYFLVVGPVEEVVKLAAVRLHAFRTPQFDTVLDGAIYGAVAGLGFATIENVVYVTQGAVNAASNVGVTPLESAFQTAASRTFAGPGHVLYSSIAGYYLGLAKFNREDAGAIVIKGLLIAAVIHATYNSLVGIVPTLIAQTGVMTHWEAVLGFIVAYDVLVGLYLYGKLSRYKSIYVESGAHHD